MDSDKKSILIREHRALKIFQPGAKEDSNRLWEFFSFISLAEKDLLNNLYDQLDDVTQDSWQSHLVKIGRAKYLSVNGELFNSYKAILNCQSDLVYRPKYFPSAQTMNDVKAFLYYEKAILAAKIGDQQVEFDTIDTARNLTSIENLKLAIALFSTRFSITYFTGKLSSYISLIEQIESQGLFPLACIGWRKAGIFARKMGNKAESMKWSAKALRLAIDYDLGILHTQIRISQAVSAYNWSDHDHARELFAQIAKDNPDSVHQAIINENLAVMSQKENDTETAIALIEQALALTMPLDHITMIPAETLFLGEQYENYIKDLDQAEHYYRIGYEHAIRYAEHGISLTGDRKKVVDAYTELLQKKHKSTSQTGMSQSARFSFAEGKSWKEIKDIFHHQLILYHSKATLNKKQIARSLDMPPTTLYSLQTRLEDRGYLLPTKDETFPDTLEPVQSYIEAHKELSWNEVNEIFEREIIHYLYEKYGYNKQRMAKVLNLSYPALLNKTRELTSVDDHLLPN